MTSSPRSRSSESLELDRYHYLHATRAELLRRLDRVEDARAAYDRALELVHSDAERRSSSASGRSWTAEHGSPAGRSPVIRAATVAQPPKMPPPPSSLPWTRSKKWRSRYCATCLPIFAACSSEDRKWIPDQMRTSMISSIASENRV